MTSITSDSQTLQLVVDCSLKGILELLSPDDVPDYLHRHAHRLAHDFLVFATNLTELKRNVKIIPHIISQIYCDPIREVHLLNLFNSIIKFGALTLQIGVLDDSIFKLGTKIQTGHNVLTTTGPDQLDQTPLFNSFGNYTRYGIELFSNMVHENVSGMSHVLGIMKPLPVDLDDGPLSGLLSPSSADLLDLDYQPLSESLSPPSADIPNLLNMQLPVLPDDIWELLNFV